MESRRGHLQQRPAGERRLVSRGALSFSNLVFAAVGKDTLISWGTGDSLLVEGAKPKSFGASDFSFGAPAVAAVAHAALVAPSDQVSGFHDAMIGSHDMMFG